MKKSDVNIGDMLQLKKSMFGRKLCAQKDSCPLTKEFLIGTVGKVAAIRVPCVSSNREFICLDIEYTDGWGKHSFRTRPYYDEVKKCRY
jgi:hypothetical protein